MIQRFKIKNSWTYENKDIENALIEHIKNIYVSNGGIDFSFQNIIYETISSSEELFSFKELRIKRFSKFVSESVLKKPQVQMD